MRGGEKVLAQLCAMYPDAPIFTLVHVPGSVSGAIEESRAISVSLLQRLPFAGTHYRYYLPLFPLASWSLAATSDTDVLISSSHAAVKAIRVPSNVVHVCYCHTPMRYIWDERGDYFKFGRARHLRRLGLGMARGWLRRWDRESAKRVDTFVANSRFVRDRIREVYDRDAVVIHPPVDTEFFTTGAERRDDSGLVVSALVPYKRVDIAVRAFSRAGRRLTVVGTGTERGALERIAGPTVEFLGEVTDERLRTLYREAGCLVFPGREDFGIVPVEATASGLPVVAFGEGGVLDSIEDGVTGVLFEEQTVDALWDAVRRCERTAFDVRILRERAERFSHARFRDAMRAVVEGALRAR